MPEPTREIKVRNIPKDASDAELAEMTRLGIQTDSKGRLPINPGVSFLEWSLSICAYCDTTVDWSKTIAHFCGKDLDA